MLNKLADFDELSLRFPATFAEIRTALTRIIYSSVTAGLSNLRLRDLELVLAEALNNVAEHAYALAPGGAVQITMARQTDHLLISIRDQGVAMASDHAPDAAPVENGTAEGGRGWLLIHALCRKVSYERVGGTNRLTLEFLSSD